MCLRLRDLLDPSRQGIRLILLLLSCQRGGLTCEAAMVDEVGGVATVTFSTDQPEDAEVRFGTDLERSTPLQSGQTEHQHDLIGLLPESEVPYQVIAGEQTCEGTISTPPLPPGITDYDVTVQTPGLEGQYVLVADVGSGGQALNVINRNGEIVWTLPGEDSITVIHAELDPDDGELVLAIQATDFQQDVGKIQRMDWAHRISDSLRTPLAHHGFALHADNTVSVLGLDIREAMVEGEPAAVAGDNVIAYAPDRTSREVFTVWDHFAIQEHDRWDLVVYPGVRDWTHGNGIHFYPDDNRYLLSLGNINTVIEVDADTGVVTEEISQTSYTLADGTAPFRFQHDAQWGPGDTLSMTSTTSNSVAVVYTIDRNNKTLAESWVHGRGETDLFAFALGENVLLENGNRMVSFGTAGVLREVSPAGEVLWELRGDPGAVAIANARVFDDFYTMQ